MLRISSHPEPRCNSASRPRLHARPKTSARTPPLKVRRSGRESTSRPQRRRCRPRHRGTRMWPPRASVPPWVRPQQRRGAWLMRVERLRALRRRWTARCWLCRAPRTLLPRCGRSAPRVPQTCGARPRLPRPPGASAKAPAAALRCRVCSRRTCRPSWTRLARSPRSRRSYRRDWPKCMGWTSARSSSMRAEKGDLFIGSFNVQASRPADC